MKLKVVYRDSDLRDKLSKFVDSYFTDGVVSHSRELVDGSICESLGVRNYLSDRFSIRNARVGHIVLCIGFVPDDLESLTSKNYVYVVSDVFDERFEYKLLHELVGFYMGDNLSILVDPKGSFMKSIHLLFSKHHDASLVEYVDLVDSYEGGGEPPSLFVRS